MATPEPGRVNNAVFRSQLLSFRDDEDGLNLASFHIVMAMSADACV